MTPKATHSGTRPTSKKTDHTGFKGIRFLELRLEGFGLYARPTRFIFPPLLGVDLRLNEKGKSTVLHGLLAVLFGLPRSSNPDEFGTARFRSWERSPGFFGTLDLLTDGRRYRIHRDFDTHNTRVTSLDADNDVLYEGEANPRGQTSSIHRYREILGELIPVTEPDLFRAAYCVEQPLPEESQISHEVQRLLTGAGVAAGEGVLSLLFQRFKSISRKTGDARIHRPGKRPTDQQTDGRLEILGQKLEALERACRDGELHFTRVREREGEVQRLSHELERVRNRRDSTQSVLETLGSYRDHTAQWERLRLRRSELDRALDTYKAHEEARQGHSDALSSRFPHLADAPQELNEQLPLALKSYRDLHSARSERQRLEQEIAGVRTELAEVQAFLQKEAALAGRTEDFWPSLHQREKLRREIAESQDALAEICQKVARIEDESPEDDRWGRLPKPPDLWVQSARKKADSFLEKWKQWKSLTDRRKVYVSAMKRWEPLLDPETKSEEIPTLEITWRQLSRIAEEAREQEQLRRQDLEEADRRALRSWRMRKLWAAMGGLGLGAILGLLAYLLVDFPPLGAVALGLVIAVIFQAIFRRAPVAPRERRGLEDASREAEVKRIEAEKKLQSFHTRWGPLLVALNLPHLDEEGLPALVREHRECEETLRKLEPTKILQGQLEKDLFSRVLTEDQDIGELGWDSLPSDIQDLRTLAEVVGESPPRNLLDLASRLSELGPSQWQAWESEAARWAEDRRQLSHLMTIQDMHLGKGATPGLPELESEFQKLNEICQPIPVETDLAELEPRWRHVRKMEERGRTLEARRDELLAAMDDARCHEETARREWNPWEARLASLLEAAGGDPDVLNTQWQETRKLRGKMTEAERLRDGALAILEGIDNSLDGLKEGLKRVEDEADSHLREMKRLEKDSDTIQHYVSLPTGDEKDGYRQKLESDLADLVEKENELETQLSEADIDLRSLGRSDVPPLAQLELEMKEIREEIARLESHRDTILETWTIMKEVVDDLPSTFGPNLVRNITDVFSRITGKAERRVNLTQDLELAILEGDHPCSMEQLSQGARDQLTLAIRLAVAEQMGRDIPLPMLFDDPFVNFDPERVESLKANLLELAQERQILLWTHDERFEGWGHTIEREPA